MSGMPASKKKKEFLEFERINKLSVAVKVIVDQCKSQEEMEFCLQEIRERFNKEL